jgi:hypothetical protein
MAGVNKVRAEGRLGERYATFEAAGISPPEKGPGVVKGVALENFGQLMDAGSRMTRWCTGRCVGSGRLPQ